MYFFRITPVVIGVLLSTGLMGCATERITYISQPAIPANLLVDCLPPLPPKKLTFGKSILYNEKLLNVIEACNIDKQAIKKINQRAYLSKK